MLYARYELRPFFGSHAHTLHVQISLRTHLQFEVVALRTCPRTFGNYFSNFQSFFNIFRILKQKRIFYNKIGCSNIVFKTKSSIILALLFQKVCKIVIAHRTPKTSRTYAHPAHFPEWISHALAHVRPHFARVRAHAPSQLI